MIDFPMTTYPLFLETVQQQCEDASKQLLSQVQAGLSGISNVTIETDSQVGLPVQVILDSAGQWQPDLIVLGCHGKRGLNKLIFGSVSQEIATQAHCSVVVVRLPKEEEKGDKKASTRTFAARAS
jgi:nucleotide-binding universal stress UspA family protein